MKFRETLWFLDRNATLPIFELESVGITHADPSYRIRRPHGVDFYTVEYVVSGRGELRLEGQHFRPEGGDCYLLPPHVPVEYWSDRRDPWEKLWINIGGALPESLMAAYQLHGAVWFRNCPMQVEFRQALAVVRERPENTSLEFAVALHRIFAGLAAHRRGGAAGRRNEPALRLKQYLEQHWREPVRLEDLACHIDRSPAQVLRIFAGEWGITPGQWLQQYRFEFARQYLINTSYTVRAVAELVGFRDEFYFANWFKRRAGVAPGVFRKQAHGWEE